MSQHRSLKGASTITAKRNVLKRFERVELLKKRGQWKEGAKSSACRRQSRTLSRRMVDASIASIEALSLVRLNRSSPRRRFASTLRRSHRGRPRHD